MLLSGRLLPGLRRTLLILSAKLAYNMSMSFNLSLEARFLLTCPASVQHFMSNVSLFRLALRYIVELCIIHPPLGLSGLWGSIDRSMPLGLLISLRFLHQYKCVSDSKYLQ